MFEADKKSKLILKSLLKFSKYKRVKKYEIN